MFFARAKRIFEQKATDRVQYGTTKYLTEAAQIYQLLEDSEAAAETTAQAKRVDKNENWGIAIWIGAGALWLAGVLATRVVFISQVSPYLQLLLACISAAGFVLVIDGQYHGGIPFRTVIATLAGMVGGIGGGYVVWRWQQHGLWWCGLAAFWIVVVAGGGGGLQAPVLPRSLVTTNGSSDTRPWRERIARLLETWARILRRPRRSTADSSKPQEEKSRSA
jgi:hypothetical protein